MKPFKSISPISPRSGAGVARWRIVVAALAAAISLGGTPQSRAQNIVASFSLNYSTTSLGSVPGVPADYGGLTLLANSPSTLLIGGSANSPQSNIYSIGVTRDARGHITGFSGTASLFAASADIDGGLAYGPGGVLFATTYGTNQLLEYKPGSTSPDKIIDLTSLGITASTGGLAFVPSGISGAGGIRITSYMGGGFYSGTLTPDGSGTYNLSSVALQSSPGGEPEGVVYVPAGSPGFSGPAALIAQYQMSKVEAYSLDANGNPIMGSAQDFLTGLTGAEGGFIDPETGDLLLSTFGGGNQVIEVQGFTNIVPEPSSLVFLFGTGCMFLLRRRRAGSGK